MSLLTFRTCVSVCGAIVFMGWFLFGLMFTQASILELIPVGTIGLLFAIRADKFVYHVIDRVMWPDRKED